ncbi:MAG: IS1595 family transposase, partial [Deltaproteobacteria bacterium]
VRAGTMFYRTKVPLGKWFWLIYRMAISKTGVSIAEMQREPQIRDYKTIWVMAHKVREAMGQRNARYRLASLVELDESFFGPTSREGKRGRASERKTTVLIAVSMYTNKEGIESPGFAHAQVVTDASAETIGQVLDRLGVDEGDRASDREDPQRWLEILRKSGKGQEYRAPSCGADTSQDGRPSAPVDAPVCLRSKSGAEGASSWGVRKASSTIPV